MTWCGTVAGTTHEDRERSGGMCLYGATSLPLRWQAAATTKTSTCSGVYGERDDRLVDSFIQPNPAQLHYNRADVVAGYRRAATIVPGTVQLRQVRSRGTLTEDSE